MKVLHFGSQTEMLDLERKYRPKLYIGYNVAIGGSENGVVSQYKHGGSRNYPDYLRYKKLIQYCVSNNLPIDSLFLDEATGYLKFTEIAPQSTYSTLTRYKYELIDESLGITSNNIKINYGNTLFVNYQNQVYPLIDVLQYSDMPYATIKKRIYKYKWTPEQACGFESPPANGYVLITLDGVECKYDYKSTYSIETLEILYNEYKKSDVNFTKVCKQYNVEYRNITRFFKRYNLNTVDRRTKEFKNEI